MKKRLLIPVTLLIFIVAASGQQTIKQARQKGHFSLVYRITADSAEKFLRKYDLDPDLFLHQTPFATFKYDSLESEKLPVGNYIIVSVVEDELITSVNASSFILKIWKRNLRCRYR